MSEFDFEKLLEDNGSLVETIFDLCDDEKKVLAGNINYEKMSDEVKELYLYFEKNLFGLSADNLQTLCCNYDCMLTEASKAYFIKGFKMGLRLAAECLLK